MPKFGAESRKHLVELHPDLQKVYNECIKHWDFSLTDGARTLEEQRKNVAKGVSKTMNSRHLPNPEGWAEAGDAVPYPRPDWGAVERGLNAMKRADPTMEAARFYAFVGFQLGVAAVLGVKVRAGADWDSDRYFHDHSFIDLPHLELVNARRVEPKVPA